MGESKMELTAITEQNKSYFSPLCTEDAFLELSLPAHYGIGAVTGESPDYLAVGLLCFRVIERDGQDEGYAVIDRICVAEDYRRQGCGKALVEELFKNLREMDVESAYIDLPEEGLSELEEFLTSCGFRHEWMESDTYLVTLDTAKEWLGETPDEYPGDLPLAEAEAMKLKRSLEQSFRDEYVKGAGEIQSLPWDVLEKNVSIVHTGKNGYDAFALFRRLPSGKLILHYFGGADEVTYDVMHEVMCDAITMAHLNYKGKTMLEIPVRSEQEDEFLHMLFPRITRKRVRRFASGG